MMFSFKRMICLVSVLLALAVSTKTQAEEPIDYFAIAGDRITATASSQAENQGPENTVNSSGLNANDLHSTERTDMWLSDIGGPQPTWIQYEFDKVYKLYEMWVWNYNDPWIFLTLGSGIKDVTIEYSADGANWTTLGIRQEFARAPGEADYAHNATIDFRGVAAKYVKLTANSNWEGFSSRCGLSEVRYIAAEGPLVVPADGAADVPRDIGLVWAPTETAVAHDVYFGTVFDDVNEADRNNPRGVLVSQDQEASTYDPTDLLDFGRTYYWRIDEVNAPPDSTIFKGDIWSFTAEPIGYPIKNVTATASSGHGSQETANGSGLDFNNLHSNWIGDMWRSDIGGPQPTWIQYEFDKIYKLCEVWVWSYNGTSELVFGWGIKDVTIEYSINGTDYATLGTSHEFAQGTGEDNYAHNTTVDFKGLAAKYVKLTANSNWGGILSQCGLSEVRFLYIPVLAREPNPDSGTTDVDVDVTLGWRAGREAAEHDVYLSTDEQAVIDSTAPVTIVTEASCSFPLDVNSTYYWRVDEVNEVETPAIWQGDIWNFSTQDYLVVDDFELYNDLDPNNPNSKRIFNAWIDEYGTATNGSTIGYIDAPFAELTIVHDGNQSMPYFYDNNFKFSEVEMTLSPAQDWTEHDVTVLVLYFYGDPSNAVDEQMYLKVNGFKVVYSGDAADILQPQWKQWNIPLEDLANQGVNLQNVMELGIGFGDEANITAGGLGVVYFDDIRLYRSAPCLEI